MRSILDMDTVQIEITNACVRDCSNCSRFCGHVKPFYMSFDQFRKAVDSMVGYPMMTGIQGGEPLLHPEFEKLCRYLSSKIPKVQLGLWTSLPKGFERYREIICETFEHIFINDHSRPDVIHHPALVGIEEAVPDKDKMWHYIDHCWAQESWSASINPSGAWFCEIAASMAMLFEEGWFSAWPVEPGWWWKIPKDFAEQMEMFCPRCGFSIPLKRRASGEAVDDISPKNLERLRGKSRKIEKGQYVVSDLTLENDFRPLATYKDIAYRNEIASRYGIFTAENPWALDPKKIFWKPYLMKNFDPETVKYRKSILESLREKHAGYPGNHIEGFTTDEMLSWLFDTAKNMSSVVEVGSWKGRSTHALLSGCRGTVWAVDHFKGSRDERAFGQSHYEATVRDISEDFMRNVGDFGNLKVMRMESLEAAKQFAPKSVDMVFIDGGHGPADIPKDIEAWLPVARKMICGKDYCCDVQLAVNGKFGKDNVKVFLDGGIWSVSL